VAMESLDILRQLFWQLIGCHTEARTWSTGIIQQGTYLRIFRIDTKA
jgi:hypothetical protein